MKQLEDFSYEDQKIIQYHLDCMKIPSDKIDYTSICSKREYYNKLEENIVTLTNYIVSDIENEKWYTIKPTSERLAKLSRLHEDENSYFEYIGKKIQSQ